MIDLRCTVIPQLGIVVLTGRLHLVELVATSNLALVGKRESGSLRRRMRRTHGISLAEPQLLDPSHHHARGFANHKVLVTDG